MMTVKFFETNHQFSNQKLWNTFTFLWMQIFMVAMLFPEFKIIIIIIIIIIINYEIYLFKQLQHIK